MTRTEISFAHLAHFVQACDSASMSEAAAGLGLVPSTLSTRLRALEARIGMSLFRRSGRRMLPLESALWLYPHAVRLLLTEEYLRLVVGRGPAEAPAQAPGPAIRLDVAHAGGTLAQAVIATIRDRYAAGMEPFVDLVFDHGGPPVHGPGGGEGGTDAVIALGSREAEDRDGAGRPGIGLGHDRWVIVPPLAGADAGQGLGDPLLPDPLPGLPEDGIAGLAALRDTHVALRDLHVHLHRHPGQRVLLPSSLLPAWARAIRPGTAACPGIAPVPVILSVGAGDLPGDFVAALRRRIAAGTDTAPRPFAPGLSYSQLSMFGAVMRSGSLSAAARSRDLTLPSVLARIRGLEAGLGQLLLHRGSTGTMPTEFGRRFAPLALALTRRTDAMLEERSRIASATKQVIGLGLPPSWGRECATSENVADALTAFRARFAQCRVDVIEGPRGQLHRAVRGGDLNLAIVGRVDAQVGKLPLGQSEDISLIVSRQLGFRPQGPLVTQDEITRLPLVLAPEQVTMHRTFLAQMRQVNRRIQPAMQVGSIPLIAAMVRRAPLCTILPQSVVRRDAEDGLVDIFPLGHIAKTRKLWMIFSTETGLTEIERALVAELQRAFARNGGQATMPGAPPAAD